jgi:hypothetical protein
MGNSPGTEWGKAWDGVGGELAAFVLQTLEEVQDATWMAEPQQQRALVQATQHYVKFYESRYTQVFLMGLAAPVSLEKVYLPTQLIDDRTIRYFEAPKTLKQLYRQRKSRNQARRASSTRPGLEVANQKQYLLVLGEPGYGKSTFLRGLGWEALKGSHGEYRHACLPLLLPLRNYRKRSLGIEIALQEQLIASGFPEPDRLLKILLKQGKILLLLDGLDEVNLKYLEEVKEEIQLFVDRYPQNRFVVSCRKVAGYRGLRRFATTEVAAPQAAEVATLLRQQLPLFLRYASDLINHLKTLVVGLNFPWMREFTHTPLFLVVLCWVYSYTQRIPTNPSAMYGEAVDLLLETTLPHGDLDSSSPWLKADLEKALLGEIAFQGLSTQLILYDHAVLMHLIGEFLEETLDLGTSPTATQVIDRLCYQGFLSKTEQGDYCFAHRTLQEYFTAHYLAQYDTQLQFLIPDRVTDLYWREVFLLVAGQVDCADRLLLLMEECAQSYLTSPRLRQLFMWSHAATTKGASPVRASAKRCAALALALDRALDVTRTLKVDLAIDYALNLDLDLAVTLDSTLAMELDRLIALDLDVDQNVELDLNIPLTLARDLKRLQLFEEGKVALLITRLEKIKSQALLNPTATPPKVLSQSVLQEWLLALNLSLDWISLTEEEAIALQNYLYIILLIHQCKGVAVRVSRSVWQGIESRMLLAS